MSTEIEAGKTYTTAYPDGREGQAVTVAAIGKDGVCGVMYLDGSIGEHHKSWLEELHETEVSQ